ncbi:unc-112-related protein-like isoform X1 [Dinothrombium tinctorium]|uniref:Unc-112-related protein-like isoform X1 n=1 Tax=Dinothrombium tinctorium TaxID=1965070 RepID=A0A3S3PJC3_9ACAR|nr:unc-112-related protein-like isoform X1 [Dinothrombium tinctorium]RWS10514.1 unc-112-related protein-like isoform X1 [Dinothrombium tinctorium]RWS10754.1 unc-112-related protein-like isoform X1 [Dinothrombium tinctorium]RWS10793.1 unc-112-related protein-like isoform X1 [Dinothrombium tinctorium]
MIADGYIVGDGSWELKIFVTDLKVERTLRVKGDLHIGGVMLKLVEDLDVALDWSDHALWWPKKNMWLSRTRTTLDQYGVQADSMLHFTPMHKTLRIQLPDLRFMDAKVDFSVQCFSAVVQLCKDLGIRHPEELSFCRPLCPEHLKKNYKYAGVSPRQRAKDAMGPIVQNNPYASNISTPDGKSSPAVDLNTTPVSHLNGSAGSFSPISNGHSTSFDNSFYMGSDPSIPSLASSPQTPTLEAKNTLIRPKSLVERARLNCGWLDSSLSLYEQDVREFDLLLLRFKFYSFYDLNPKLDSARINQIYEQARWSLLTEEIECTEEEMMMFASLNLQVNLQSNSPVPERTNTTSNDDIDSALTELQVQLEGSSMMNTSGGNITNIPELADYLRFMKPRKFTLKSYKRYFFVFKDTRLAIYKSKDERLGPPAIAINLKGCEVTPDVNLSQRRYGIKLEVPAQEGMVEYLIRCDAEEQYAKWMAAFHMASKGKTMADASFDSEVKQILDLLSMQHPAPAPAISPNQININPEDYIAPRFLRKLKSRGQIIQRILEAHANVKDLNSVEAKLNFIKAWQALPEYGISLFVVKFDGSKKEELLGVASNRLMRMDPNTGDHIKTWRYSTMKAWNVNWEIKKMLVQFEEEDVQFSCLSADCKVVHEFIGGYIFLSMRSKDSNQTLNEELFHKLTGGWV